MKEALIPFFFLPNPNMAKLTARQNTAEHLIVNQRNIWKFQKRNSLYSQSWIRAKD